MYASDRQKFRSPISKLDQTIKIRQSAIEGSASRHNEPVQAPSKRRTDEQLTMTPVVRLAAIVAQKLHPVPFRNVFRVLLDEV
jgi:hypothetical protein